MYLQRVNSAENCVPTWVDRELYLKGVEKLITVYLQSVDRAENQGMNRMRPMCMCAYKRSTEYLQEVDRELCTNKADRAENCVPLRGRWSLELCVHVLRD